MDMNAVANQFGGDFLCLENRADEPWAAMVEWRHPVEQVRRVSRARGNGRLRLLERRARMTERYTQPVRGQPLNEIESTVDFRCDRHDADVRRTSLNFGQNFSTIEFIVGGPS